MRGGGRVSALGLAIALIGCDATDDGPRPTPLDDAPSMAAHPIGPLPGPDRPTAVAVNPFEGDPDAVGEGRRLFVWFNCAGCHGGRAGGGMGPTLRDWHWIYGGSDADIYSSIAQGRAHGMPAWGTKLPSDQIWKLVSYIRSLETAEEPAPPPPNRSFPDAPAGRVIQGVAGGEP